MSKSRGRSVGTFPPRTSDGRALATGSTGVGGGAPTTATYITQIPDAGLSAEQALSLLATGLMKSTTATGVVSIIVPGAGIETWLATPSSANLLAALTTKTGTGLVVFDTTPTFTTNVTCPLVIGGTGAASALVLRSTSGTGGAGADIVFQTGTNGGTEVARMLNSGFVGVGVVTPLSRLQAAQNSGTFGTYQATYTGSAAIDTILGVTASLTARASAGFAWNPLLALNEISIASGTVNTWFSYALNAITHVKSSDGATYGAASTHGAGSYLCRYEGSGSLTVLQGIQVRATVGGPGNITTSMDAIDVGITHDNTSTSGTSAIGRAIVIRRPTLKGSAPGRTMTDTYGLDIERQDTALGTQTNVGFALRTQGTLDKIEFGSKFTRYNSIALVSGGVPSEVATVDLTAQAAAIAATTAYAVPAAGAGMYRISWVATVTQAATTSCVLGGANGFQVKFTDADDSVVKTSNPTTVTAHTSAVNGTTTTVSGVCVANCKASTNLQYLFDYTSVGGTAMQFNLHIKVEAL